MNYKKIKEKTAEGVLFTSSTITSITVLLIVIFLFKEGLGIFNSTAYEPNHVLALHKDNPVKHLTSQQVKNIFDQQITNWKAVGGKNDTILLFTLGEITNYTTEEELGAGFEHVPAKVDSILAANPGMIAFLHEKYFPKNFHGTMLNQDKITLSNFLGGREWIPTATPAAQFGVLPLILGTLWVSLGAILLALPIGLAVSVYLAEVSGVRLRNFLKPVIELLAGIPSVVYGFFGLVGLVPFIQDTFNLPVGETALAGMIILAIMALPTIITISEDALRTTPVSLKEASLALGASKWQTIVRVTIPYSMSGITTASILGVGRAIGETMAVLMVTGNASVIPSSILEPVRTIPATIAAELGEAPYGGAHFKALFALGIILFIITLSFNLIVDYVKVRRKKLMS
ncbi:MAG TPA: phosphate ABC transporter permease subunit PstC [Bacteroidales bacterium]|nr:phosphate ABC transporter permease subunit PstC [Bacteroidales bacterium]